MELHHWLILALGFAYPIGFLMGALMVRGVNKND